jgi:hypothetical protein
MDGKKQDYDHHQSHHFLNAYLKLHLNIIFILLTKQSNFQDRYHIKIYYAFLLNVFSKIQLYYNFYLYNF